ncbi:hypothetical protein HPHPH21_0140 [Helicobacter pylori Hp H-21]|nr:hypothetical protein HPHPH21_0140 [Helicobacter pylori Hp H-21]
MIIIHYFEILIKRKNKKKNKKAENKRETKLSKAPPKER